MVVNLIGSLISIAFVGGAFAIFLGAILSVSKSTLPHNHKLVWCGAIFLLPVVAPLYWLLVERKRHSIPGLPR